ncbi:glycosyltransferase family 39 protein [Mycolicibacterium sp. P1-5]|uniref:glycosyltransferase family 39 protein n=1 Tax=Mycolicibacterium sp. P1-5 TaxID=2024617 RepID=UPI0018845C50|nr:glycosyltransferase family 39 protein [Mycolicibacterium sp. P1-5]
MPAGATRRSKADYVLVLVLVAVAVLIYLPKLMAVVLVDHDDVISIMTATCNQGNFINSPLKGQWADVSQWQQYWRLDSHWCFGQIESDMVHYDIHPPFYFWVLHCWFVLFGVSLVSGLALNLVVVCLTAVIIYVTCRVLAVSGPLSFLATLAWTVSLPSRTAVGVIRQYSLFTMLAAVLLLVAILWLEKKQLRYLFGLCGVLAVGFLTHFQFPIPATVTVFCVAAILWRRRAFVKIAQLVLAVVVAAVVFYVVEPGFMESVGRAHDQAQSFTFPQLFQRTAAFIPTALQLFNPLNWSHPLPYGLLDWAQPRYVVINLLSITIGVGAAYLVVSTVVRAIRSGPRGLDRWLTVRRLPICAGVLCLLTIFAMYVSFISPVHAIGLQYLHFVTPFLFVGVARMVQDRQDAQDSPDFRWPRLVTGLPVVLLMCAVLSSALFVVHRSELEPVRDIAHADALIVDSDHEGVLPAILWHADPSTKVFAASQDVILAKHPDAGPAVAAHECYYVSSTAYENNRAKQEQIRQWLRSLGHGDEAALRQGVVPLIPLGGDIYRFTR